MFSLAIIMLMMQGLISLHSFWKMAGMMSGTAPSV
jgi:hypothetical protein